MIKSTNQLKAKVRNISGGNDKVSKSYIRMFFMERFMERVSVSSYNDHFILKGGMLVSSLLGVDLRSTMDIDTTVKALPLTIEDIERIVLEICNIQLEDNVNFSITKIESIMDDFEYPGVRVHIEAHLERIRQPIKIDISTDDVITPRAIEYEYKLLFEERSIRLHTYNTETMIAEKVQTVLNRGLANTRMRDFYDLYELMNHIEISTDVVKEAFVATCKKRETIFSTEQIETIINAISNSTEMESLWNQFRDKNHFVENIAYEVIINSVVDTIRTITK